MNARLYTDAASPGEVIARQAANEHQLTFSCFEAPAVAFQLRCGADARTAKRGCDICFASQTNATTARSRPVLINSHGNV